MTVRRLPLLLGVLAFAGGIGVVVGLLEFGLSQPVLVVAGLVAVVIGIRAVFRRRDARRYADTPDPEERSTAPVPGAKLSDALAELRRLTPGYAGTSHNTVGGLRAAVIGALTRFEGDSVEEATDRLEAGTWTDDRTAATFLSRELEAPSPSLRARLAATVDRRSTYYRGVRRAAAAIGSIGYDAGEIARGELPRYERGPTGRNDRSDPERRTRTATESIDGIRAYRERSTGYWTGIGVIALMAVGIGVIGESPAAVLAGVVGVGYAGFARALEAPTLDLSVDRRLSDETPEPGDEVDVTVTITNERDAFVPDLRFVDGVPPGLSVTEGSSRLGTALRPGESETLEYTVTARRGEHAFDPALAIARDLSRSSEREFLVGSETVVHCEPELRPVAAPVPLQATAASFAGRLQTAEGGSGTTFHSVREYRKSDPLTRVDWNRHAKTGELATLEFHEERAARVVVLVDTRQAAYLAPDDDTPHAVDRSVAVAGRIAASLLADGDTVGLAAIGPGNRDGDTEEPCWLAPASGRHHEHQFRELLASHPQFTTTRPERESGWIRQLRAIRRRLSAETQIVLLTPLCDYGSVDIARRLDARGHAVTVISPDPTADRTVGERLARVGRRIRRFDLQHAGIPVVDWPADASIDEVFARQRAGGRR